MDRIAYWLLPVADDEDRLRQCIGELAERHGGPLFDPHVTVFAGTMDEPPAWQWPERLRHVARDVGEVSLTVSGIGHSSEFTKTLYLHLQSHPLLDALHRRSRSFSRGPLRYVLEPHLSLLYASLSEQERQAAAAALRPPLNTVRFDQLRVVRTGARIVGPEDVKSWWALASVKLEG